MDSSSRILYIPPPKSLVWLGSSLSDIRRFPAKARRTAGWELWRVQCGLNPSDWKPMPVIGSGVREIRVRAGGSYRVVYLARFAEAVYVLHAFEKRSQATAAGDLWVAGQRLRLLLRERSQR